MTCVLKYYFSLVFTFNICMLSQGTLYNHGKNVDHSAYLSPEEILRRRKLIEPYLSGIAEKQKDWLETNHMVLPKSLRKDDNNLKDSPWNEKFDADVIKSSVKLKMPEKDLSNAANHADDPRSIVKDANNGENSQLKEEYNADVNVQSPGVLYNFNGKKLKTTKKDLPHAAKPATVVAISIFKQANNIKVSLLKKNIGMWAQFKRDVRKYVCSDEGQSLSFFAICVLIYIEYRFVFPFFMGSFKSSVAHVESKVGDVKLDEGAKILQRLLVSSNLPQLTYIDLADAYKDVIKKCCTVCKENDLSKS